MGGAITRGSHGCCRGGERLRFGVPHGHWKATTPVAGLHRIGVIARMVLHGSSSAAGTSSHQTVRARLWIR